MKGKKTIFGAIFAPVFAFAVVLSSGVVASSVQAQESGYGGDSVSCTMHANPGTIAQGDSSTLIWYSSDNVVSANLEDFGDVDPEHWYWIPSVSTSRTYTLTVYGADGQSSTCEAEIMVEGEDGGEVEAGTPSCSVTPSHHLIKAGGETTLNWTSENAVSAKISPTGSASYFAEGSANGSWYINGINDSRSYSVTVFNANGDSATCDTPITVEGEQHEQEEHEQEHVDHTYCSITYPGRVMEDNDNNGWGDTQSDEAGCLMDPITDEEEETTGTLSCSTYAEPSVIVAEDGSTTLNWTSENAVSAKLSPSGSSSYFADVDVDGSWFISGITNSRTYDVTVFSEDGESVVCPIPLTVNEDYVAEEEMMEEDVMEEEVMEEEVMEEEVGEEVEAEINEPAITLEVVVMDGDLDVRDLLFARQGCETRSVDTYTISSGTSKIVDACYESLLPNGEFQSENSFYFIDTPENYDITISGENCDAAGYRVERGLNGEPAVDATCIYTFSESDVLSTEDEEVSSVVEPIIADVPVINGDDLGM